MKTRLKKSVYAFMAFFSMLTGPVWFIIWIISGFDIIDWCVKGFNK